MLQKTAQDAVEENGNSLQNAVSRGCWAIPCPGRSVAQQPRLTDNPAVVTEWQVTL